MKPILLAALALPLLLAGCATDVAVDGGGYYGPGYYGPGYAYDDGYYGGSIVDVGVGGYYGYDRGYYHQHHYDNISGSRSAAFARSNTRVNSSHASFAGVSRTSSHSGASHASASVSSGGGHGGGRR